MEADALENPPPSQAQLLQEADANRDHERKQRLEDQIAEDSTLGLDEDEVMDMINEGEE
jgi:hypothetical protein